MTALFYDNLAVQIINTDSPLLLLDTCMILDIVRAPIREQIGVHDIEAVHTVIERATQAPHKVSLVIVEQVNNEFLENIDAVEKETRNELQKTQDRFMGSLKRMEALSSANHIPSNIDLSSLGFPEKGRQLAEQIVQTSTILEFHDDEAVKAVNRVNRAKPPATQAKQSVKDCLITESYLRLASVLCKTGFSHNMVFATSNTKDYQQDHKNLHPDLRTEFDAVRLEYSPSWSAARYELDRH